MILNDAAMKCFANVTLYTSHSICLFISFYSDTLYRQVLRCMIFLAWRLVSTPLEMTESLSRDILKFK